MKVPKKVPIIIIIVLYLALVAIATVFAANEEPEAEHTPTPTATATETVSPSPTAQKTQCEIDIENIQVALDAYLDAHGNWPTSNGSPGKIEWDKLVPEFLNATPSTANSCKWQVNSDPEGQICKPPSC
jgi:hypothetical protein